MSSWLNNAKPRKIINNIQRSQRDVQPTTINYSSYDLLHHISSHDVSIKIQKFSDKCTNAFITFIIPSINRETLYETLMSLQKQTIDNWKAIIIFDGCEPTDKNLIELLSNDHFLHFSINKLGVIRDLTHGAAGFVRNIAMNIVTTPWIGFLDDDDCLLPTYTSALLEEIKITPSTDVVLFRMIDKDQIIPPNYINNIVRDYVGISFCYKTALFREGFQFEQSEKEDFNLLNSIKNAKKKMVISPFITYLVRDSKFIYSNLPRIMIN